VELRCPEDNAPRDFVAATHYETPGFTAVQFTIHKTVRSLRMQMVHTYKNQTSKNSQHECSNVKLSTTLKISHIYNLLTLTK